jgi:iron(III) transport system ATP-binding protein
MALSDRIVVMDFGALIQQDDTPINVYLRPANKFVFSFIGLSNFLDVDVVENRVYLRGARDAGPLTAAVPGHVPGKPPTLACRPGEIEMVAAGGVRGIVSRRVLLGDIIDYRVRIGPTEVRVQRNVRKPLFSEGDACGLVFSALHWYDGSGARVNA